MDSLVFLDSPDSAKVQPHYVLHGDEDFLKRQVIKKLRRCVFAREEGESAVSVYRGETATFAEVFDELETVGLFTSRRMVVVENADPFVTKFRPHLESKLAPPPAKASGKGKTERAEVHGSGVLVLDVKTWPANTRLAKMVPATVTMVCKAPPPYKVAEWCVKWAAGQQQKSLSGPAAGLLVDLVGPDLGLLDQEIAKLAIYVGNKPGIDVGDVDRLVGHSRAENIWRILDAIAEGKNAEALTILGRLFDQGEEALRILGAFGSQLRRLGQAARLTAHGKRLTQALEELGTPPFALKSSENQLRHLGRPRAEKLYDWLIEVHMGIRGDSPLSERTLLERLLVRMCGKEVKS